MSETTNNTICPHCDMGIVDSGGFAPWTPPILVKCQYCRGDWRNYLENPAPQPDVSPTNHMDALQPMEEHLIGQFNALIQKESDAYNEMMGTKFIKPNVSQVHSFVYEGPHYTPEQKAYLEELEAKFEDRLREERKKCEAAEYNQLMDLTLTYQWEDVRSIQCPECCTGGFGCTPYTKCQVCRGGGYVKAVIIRPPQP